MRGPLYGHTHKEGANKEYVNCLEKAAGFLKKVQVRSDDPKTNGRFGGTSDQWTYDHAMATMAMCELLVMSADIGLKEPVTDAVNFCLLAQNDGLGWRYGVKPGDNDTSVTGWMVLALKTAKNAPLEIPKERFDSAFQGALKWFQRVTAANGRAGYVSPGDTGSMLAIYAKKSPYRFSKNLSAMTAMGILCRIFCGEKRQGDAVRKGVKLLEWGPVGGRIYSTALGAMALGVDYRFRRLQEQPPSVEKPEKKPEKK